MTGTGSHSVGGCKCCPSCGEWADWHATLGIWVCGNLYCPAKTEATFTTSDNTT